MYTRVIVPSFNVSASPAKTAPIAERDDAGLAVDVARHRGGPGRCAEEPSCRGSSAQEEG